MTFEQAASHSLPRLRELRAAARRLNADQTLALTQGVHAAFAAVMAKEGRNIFAQYSKAMLKQIEP